MRIGKKNSTPTNIWQFNGCMIGEPGVGKSSTVYEMCKKMLGEGQFMFANIGKEDGLKALEGIEYVTCDSWSEDYDEDNNTVGFATLVDSIVDEKTESYPELKLLVIDTLDELNILSRDEVVRRHNKQHPDKKVTSAQAAFGGFMAGIDMANQLVLDKLWELKKVGVNFFLIAHTKIKEQTDLATGENWSQLTANMTIRDFNAFKTKLDYLCVAYIDRNIIHEKSKKDPKKTTGVIASEARKVVFRSDDFSIDSKSRFADIVPEVPLDADAIINALQQAINATIEKAGGSVEQRKAENAVVLEKRNAEIAEAEAKHKQQKELDTIVSSLKDWIQSNKPNPDKVKALIAKSKELGIANPLDVASLEDAKTLLAYAETL